MSFFVKINAISAIYALLLFVPIELMVNVYRLSRLTNVNIDQMVIIIGLMSLMTLMSGSIGLFILTQKWLNGRKSSFWSVILWVPYHVLYVFLFASIFPITYGGDEPGPGTGFMILALLILYPVYIFFINAAGLAYHDKQAPLS
ncbi:hypothetical protein GWK91_02165 [Virgibacillus sp. MSP4-1]|uniref:hypothetical protein n=1 Tax=Virgibacillus sp. MSP4-1 TaxID=2700081 RepID=UPI0003A516B1|nr:hypothetical protein [Virgibacillus sp. MSP4-1]QHS21821.1 hypothetical protein GWK91_02165 [Virgibacillus sp. MSP4-1]